MVKFGNVAFEISIRWTTLCRGTKYSKIATIINSQMFLIRTDLLIRFMEKPLITKANGICFNLYYLLKKSVYVFSYVNY